jgi:hypothetical protein
LHNADELVETGGSGVLRCALDLVSVESDSSDVRTCRVGDRASWTPHAAPCVKDSVALGDAERLDEPELVPYDGCVVCLANSRVCKVKALTPAVPALVWEVVGNHAEGMRMLASTNAELTGTMTLSHPQE